MDRDELQRRAKQKLRAIQRRRRDPRYRRTLGRFVALGLLTTNEAIAPHHELLSVEDVLWAGEVEPRFLELLPALLVKTPSVFDDASAMPEDLARAVRRLRRNLQPERFRGIAGDRLLRWLPEVGRVQKVPSRMKSFRLTPEDLRILEALASELRVSETEVLRRGLRALL